MRFVCPALWFIPHEPRKKDTHSLIDMGLHILVQQQTHYTTMNFIFLALNISKVWSPLV